MQFTYRAKQDKRTEASGVVEAMDRTAAVAHLKQMGLFPLEVVPLEQKRAPAGVLRQRALKPTDLALWARTIGQGLQAGLSLTQALHLLAEQESGRPAGQVAAFLEAQVTGGANLADAMRMPQVNTSFPSVAVALVQAGEASGALEQVLEALTQQVEAESELVSKVRGALVYPAFVLLVGLATVSALIWFVVPKLGLLFEETGQPLPWMTNMMIQSGQGLVWAVGLGLLLLIVGWLAVRVGWLKIPIGVWGMNLLRQIPLLGRLAEQGEMARLTSTLGLLLAHGLPLPEALRLGGATVGLSRLQAQMKRSERDVMEGMALSASLRRGGVGEAFLLTMVAMGEAQGDLARAFTQAGERYRQEVDRSVKTMSSLIEPVMILLVGLVVGGIVFAMLLPIFQLNFNVG